MIRVTAERNKGLQVVVKERLSRPAVHELRKTCDGHSAGVSPQCSFFDRSTPTLSIRSTGFERGRTRRMNNHFGKVQICKLAAIRPTD
jgi:hypothetical protein